MLQCARRSGSTRFARSWLWSGLFAIACSRAPAASEPVVPTPAEEPAAAGRTVVVAPRAATGDGSLELSAYVRAGIPDPGAAWRVDQYEQAVAVLVRSAASGRAGLPRRFSARSGALFSRLVADDNFQTEGAPSSAQAAELAARSVALVSSLCGLYAPGNDGADLASEQVALVGALLARLEVALARAGARAGVDASWSEAYEQQKRAVLAVFRGALTMLGETTRYSDAERAELRGLLGTEQAGLLRHLSAADRGSLEEALASAR